MPKYKVTLGSNDYQVDAPDPDTAWAWANSYVKSPEAKERTVGESFKDVGAGLLSGIGQLGQFPGQLYGLATGNFDKSGLYGAAQDLEHYGESLKSQGLKTRESARQIAIDEAAKKGVLSEAKTAAGETLTDPALLINFVAEQLPAQLPALLAALGGPEASLGVAAARAAAKKAVGEAAKKEAENLAKQAAIKSGTRAAVGTGAIQQGADVGAQTYKDVYDELVARKATPEQAAKGAIDLARAAGASGAVISLLAQNLPGAQAMERAFAGERTGLGRIAGAGLGALKEMPSEMIEEGGGQFTQNLAKREVNPNQSLTQGLGTAIGLAGLGGGVMGGVTGALAGKGEPGVDINLTNIPADQQQTQQVTTNRNMADLLKSADEIKAQELADKAKAEGKVAPKPKRDKKEFVSSAIPGSIEELDEKIASTQAEVNRLQTNINANKDPANPYVFKNKKHEDNTINRLTRTNAELNSYQQTLAQRLAAGEKRAEQPINPPSGTSAGVPGGANTNVPPAGGSQGTTAAGVVSPGTNAPGANAGTQPRTPPINLPPEMQAAKDLIDAIDKGGVPLDTRKLNNIARNIGLEVKKSAKPEETITRIRDALSRTESQPGTPSTATDQNNTFMEDEINPPTDQQGTPPVTPTPPKPPAPPKTTTSYTLEKPEGGNSYAKYSFTDENGVRYNVGNDGEVHVTVPPALKNQTDGIDKIVFRDGDTRRGAYSSSNLPAFVPNSIRQAIAQHVKTRGNNGQGVNDIAAAVATAKTNLQNQGQAATTPPVGATKATQDARAKLDALKKKKSQELPSTGALGYKVMTDAERDKAISPKQTGVKKAKPVEKAIDPQVADFARSLKINPSNFKSEDELLDAIDRYIFSKEEEESRTQTPIGKRKDINVAPAVINSYEERAGLHNSQFKERAEGTVPAAFNSLTQDEQDFLLDKVPSNVFNKDTNQKQTDFDSAILELSEYIKNKRANKEAVRREGTKEGLSEEEIVSKQKAVEDESTARNRYSKQQNSFTELGKFPPWGSLSQASKNLYNAINQEDSVLEQALAFRLVKDQIEQEAKDPASKDAATEAEAIAIGQMIRQAQLERKRQPAGKGDILPLHILVKLRRGDTNAVLEYIKEHGTGIKVGKSKFGRVKTLGIFNAKQDDLIHHKIKTSIIFRSLAESLLDIKNLKVNVVFNPEMVFNDIGTYNANTNTLSFGPYGLDEATFLHEMTHAATVKLIHQYYTNPESLTARQREAVEHIIAIAAEAKRHLFTKDKGIYKGAFDNLYEFVAYAMTDDKFQAELAKIQIPRLAKFTEKTGENLELEEMREHKIKGYSHIFDDLWSRFAGTLAHLYELFRPNAETTRLLVPSKTSKFDIAAENDVRERESWESQVRDAANKNLLKEAVEKLRTAINNPSPNVNQKALADAKSLVEQFDKGQVVISEAPRSTVVKEKAKEGEKQKTKQVTTPGVYDLFKNINNIGKGLNLNLDLEPARANQQKTAKEFSEARSTKEDTEKLKNIHTKKSFDEAAKELEEDKEAPLFGGERNVKNIEVTDTGKLFTDPDAVTDEDKALAKIEEADEEKSFSKTFYRKAGITKLEPLPYTTYGYRGNLLLELLIAVEDVFAAPEGGIEKLGGIEGVATELQLTKPASPTVERTADEIIAAQKIPTQATIGTISKFLTSTRGVVQLATKFASDRFPIKFWEDALQRADKIIHEGPMLNNIYTQIVLAAARAKDLYLTYVASPSYELSNSIGEYAKASKLTNDEALKTLNAYMLAEHEGERRGVKYMLNVPLSQIEVKNIANSGMDLSPADFRKKIFDLVESGTLSKDEIKTLRKELDAVVKQYVDPAGYSPTGKKATKLEDTEYNVIGGVTTKEVQNLKDKLKKDPNKNLFYKVQKSVQDLQKVTTELNRQANYWSKPVQSVVDFYGWENYIPFKGKEIAGSGDDLLDFDSRHYGRELQDVQNSFDGRETFADNSLIQIKSDATRAAMRAGRKDYTLAIKNAIEQKLLAGHKVGTILFSERDTVDLNQYKGTKTFFHYNENGTIDIYAVDDAVKLEAIRRTYKDTNPLIDQLNNLTSTVGMFHTRYNIAFAPMNFFRDALTNAFTIAVDKGIGAAAQYIGAVAKQVANGGVIKAYRFAQLYNAGKIKELEAFIARDKSGYMKDMLEYVREGGMVSYLQGLTIKGTYKDLQADINSSNLKKAKDATNMFFDNYMDMFELASRTAAYRVSKSGYKAGGATDAAAKTRAAAYVKGLANFEQVGEWGRGAGAMFMFFRPAATGAVRAIETLGPMFRDTEKAIQTDLSPEVQKDAKAVAKFRESHEKQRKAAYAMSMALGGMGVAIYMMSLGLSDDDDMGRNRAATDDVNRWTKYARFFVPGMESPIQIPWGYGLGAFASAGAQLAAISTGQISIKEGLSNIISVGTDSFLPLPVSRINMFDNFPAWAMDTATPSIMRPFFEFQMNMDGLGREIYNNRQTRVGDAYTGGDSIPELWKDAAKTLYRVAGVDWSPNTLYFFANNYADGLTRMAQNGYNLSMLATGEKEFNPKTDTILFDSFFGAKSNYDARKFTEVENKVKQLEKGLGLEDADPEEYYKFLEKNPLAETIVEDFNKGTGGTLKELRKEANDIRKNPNIRPKDRTALLNNIIQAENIEKRLMIEDLKTYGIEP